MHQSIVRVLLVDDDEDSFVLVRELLAQNHKRVGFELDWAQTYSQGLNAIRGARHDVYLLDQRLGADRGLDLLKQVVAEGCRRPIVLLSGFDGAEVALAALGAGAADFLSKRDLNASSLASTLLYVLERHQCLIASESLRKTRDELDLARVIQQRMLRPRLPKLSGLDISGICQPAAAAGGDFFDAFCTTQGLVGVVVADVSSHGIGPALIMAETRRLVRTMSRVAEDLSDVLVVANDALLEDTDDNLFVTLFLAFIDPLHHTMIYAGAGHEGFLLRHSGKIDRLESTSVPLGVLEREPFQHSRDIVLHDGDLLLLLTDGFQEALSPSGELFGRERALAPVLENRHLSAQQIADHLIEAVNAHCRPELPQDDVTAVVVKVGQEWPAAA